MKRGSSPAKVERVIKGGKRYYKKADRKPVPFHPLFDILTRTTQALVAKEGEDSPSVTTVLGVLAKPALISWASREERKMMVALAGKLYEELALVSSEPVSKDKFMAILLEEAGKPANRRLLEKAANVGTEVHKRIEWEFKGELNREREETPPTLTTTQAERAFTRWQEWREQVKLKPLDMEKGLYSSVFGFGGTLDLLAEVTIPEQQVKDIVSINIVPETTKIVVLDFKTGKHIYEEAFLQNIAYRMALAEEGIETHGGIIVRLPKYEDDPVFDAQPVPEDDMLGPVFLALRLAYQWVNAHTPKRSKPATPPQVGVDSVVEVV